MNKRQIAKETKQLDNNPNMKLQVTKTKSGFNSYRVYGNEYFQDDKDEKTIGFIKNPMTLKQFEEWLNENLPVR